MEAALVHPLFLMHAHNLITGTTVPEDASLTSSIDISVVIVNYNVREFLHECLSSLSRPHTNLQLEVIVVDNNSHDNSIGTLQPLFPDVRFLGLDSNLGFGRANNVGIEAARGRYILLLNPDTIVQEDTLESMIRYMDEHPHVGISGCKVLNADGSFQMQCRRGFPSPWTSFCKLFGLQALFPKSPLFARYNQTFRSEDETYMVDAVIGAFMFCRADALRAIGGFDPDFFMYGEDLDLCFRMKQSGFETAYVPITTIVHYKGESTRRSSINELRVFYQAMEIFAHKHYGHSKLFLLFLKAGIRLRSLVAYVMRHKRSLLVLFIDVLSVIATFVLAVKLRRGAYLALPNYAFPTVFIVLPLVVAGCMILVGEYFEYRPTIRRAAVGLLASFFVLSSLTYYWNEYAFSRGVLLMTIGFSFVALSITRACLSLLERLSGGGKRRRVLLVGTRDHVMTAMNALRHEHAPHIEFVGAVQEDETDGIDENRSIIGHVDYLTRTVENQEVDDVIVVGNELSYTMLMQSMQALSGRGVRFHIAGEPKHVVALGIAETISSQSGLVDRYRILSFRVRAFRRVFDIVGSILALLILSPLRILARSKRRTWWSDWWNVLRGRMSIVGLYPPTGDLASVAKPGFTGLAHVSHPEELSPQTLQELNEYYVQNYRPSLDLDIIIKSLFSHR